MYDRVIDDGLHFICSQISLVLDCTVVSMFRRPTTPDPPLLRPYCAAGTGKRRGGVTARLESAPGCPRTFIWVSALVVGNLLQSNCPCVAEHSYSGRFVTP